MGVRAFCPRMQGELDVAFPSAARVAARRGGRARDLDTGQCRRFPGLRVGPGATHDAVAGRHAPVRREHARQPPRDLLGRRRRHRARRRRCRSASSRCAVGPHATPRSGWSTTSPTASASSTSPRRPPRVMRTLLVGDEPRDIVFAGAGATAPSSPRPTAASTAPTPRSPACPARATRSSPPPASDRADVWVFDAGEPRRHARRHAAPDRDALRRHAARARGEPGRQHRLRRRLPLGQPDHDRQRRHGLQRLRHRRAVHQLAGPPDPGRRAAARRPTHQGNQAPEVGLIVKFDDGDRPLGGRARPQLDERGALQPARLRRVRDRRRHARRRANVFDAASARSSSTWRSTRSPGTIYVIEHRGAERGPLRGPRRLRDGPGREAAGRARDGPGRPAPRAHHGARRRERRPAPPEQAHRLLACCRLRSAPSRRTASRRRRTWPSPATAPTLYVAAFGSSKVGVFDTATLEDDTFDPTLQSAQLHRRERRRPGRPRARRGARPPLRAHALRQLGLGRRPRAPATRPRTSRSTTRSRPTS